METLLFKRHKTLVLLSLFFLTAVIFFYLYYNKNYYPDIKKINNIFEEKVKKLDEEIEIKAREFEERSNIVYKKYLSNKLTHHQMRTGEALIFEKDGVVENYYGEVFFFRKKNIEINKWIFLKKENNLYFLKRMAGNTYYMDFFSDMEKVFQNIDEDLPFISKEVNFYAIPVTEDKNKFQYDDINNSFYIYHIFKSSNNQLLVVLKFFRSDFSIHYSRQQRFWFFVIYFFIALCFFPLFRKKTNPLSRFIYYLILNFSAIYLSLLIKSNEIYLKLLNIEIRSLYFYLYISILLLIFSSYVNKRILSPVFKSIISLSMMSLSLFLLYIIESSLNFSNAIFELDFNYILLLIIFFLLLISPFRISVKLQNNKIIFRMIFPVISIIFLSYIISLITGFGLLTTGFLFFILYIYQILNKSLLSRVIQIFLIAASLFFILYNHELNEKKEYISGGLRDIFSNQNNYAKFISREIIHNINLKNEVLSEFFSKESNTELESIWRRSIASKENISSGIYIISDKNKIINSFSYRIPYLNVKIDKFFPFWEIDEFNAEYFGKTISLAVAYINVYDNYKYLGRIMIQIINSSDLIIKDHPEDNIFTLNTRIKGEDLSYIKLNNKNQIIENPSNIDIPNISGLAGVKVGWKEFSFMNIKFSGFIFKNNEDTIIIFYPVSSYVVILSNIIQIFIFFLILKIILNIGNLKSFNWGTFFHTFSVRVFAILILLSFVTAIVFSVFSLQYNKRSRELNIRQLVFNSGGVAYNIISDIIEKEMRIDQNDLFFLSKLLNADISIYEKNQLIDTSNYKMIINSRIPSYINSRIPLDLRENEKFVISNDQYSSKIFFEVAGYLVRIDYTKRKSDFSYWRNIYSDFIINLFFILTISGITLALIFRNKILSPINTLNNKMLKAEKGSLETIETIPGEIEIKSLFTGFNSMINGIREQRKKISDISRMKTLVKISRWIAHEVKNPLTPIKLSSEQILRSLKDKRKGYESTINESVKYIIDETDHLKEISLGFLDLSNLDKVIEEKFDIVDLFKNEIEKMDRIYKNVTFELKYNREEIYVILDKIKIKQVLKNLIINSIDAISEKGGIISIEINGNKEELKVIVKDNGVGMAVDDPSLIFNEEFSTKTSGTGLGLFIVKRIVELHEGFVNISSVPGKGTTVALTIPEKGERSQ
ncbi:MAG: HAMP domain-containing sensor histidine kinase [Acidobacteriota bacterium]